MSNHRGKMPIILSTIPIIIATFISIGECAPTLTKSLAPVWLPDDQLDNNRRNKNSELWNNKSFDTTTNPSIKSNARIIRHISSLPLRRDSYLEREWTTGNLPFSILYVNTQHARKTKNVKVPVDSNTQANKQQNNRPTKRNRATERMRRQYPIIPELFMSYGWAN